MQNKLARTDFGLLLARAWQLYSQSLHVTFPVTFLCGALPVLAVLVIVYFGVATAFEPALRVAQAVLRSLLENGFDEWAMGAAVEQVLSTFGGLNLLEVILRAAGSLGATALVLVLMLPLMPACRLLLAPIGHGASLQAQLCALCGDKPGFSAAFSFAYRRMGKLLMLELLMIPVGAAVLALAAVVCAAAGKLPVAGDWVGLLAVLAALVLNGCVRRIASLHVLRDNARVFSALGTAFKCFFTDWTYAASGSLFYAGLSLGAVLICAVDVLLMVLAMLPPFAVVLFITLFLPLLQALTVMMVQEQKRRADKSAPQLPEK